MKTNTILCASLFASLLAGCGGGDSGSSSPGTSPAGGPSGVVVPASQPAASSGNALPPNTSTGMAPQPNTQSGTSSVPATSPDVAAVLPDPKQGDNLDSVAGTSETSPYQTVSSLPLGQIQIDESVLMSSTVSSTRNFPPNPVDLIDRVTNPVMGKTRLRLTEKSAGQGDDFKAVGLSAEDVGVSGNMLNEIIVSPLSISQKIGANTFTMSYHGTPRFSLGRLSMGGYAVVGAWERDTRGAYTNPIIDGAFSFGSRTQVDELINISQRDYAGIALGQHRYTTDWVSDPSLPYAAAAPKATLDRTGKNLTFSIPKFRKDPVSGDWTSQTDLFGPPLLTCVASIDLKNNKFSCALRSTDGYPSAGILVGHFYGPKGKEIAGVINYTDWSTFRLNQVVSGFLLEAQ